MRIISRSTLKAFWSKKEYRDSEQPLKAWYDEAKNAFWKNPTDIKVKYRNASFIENNRVIFNIHGNKYRLIVAFKYKFGIGYVRFVGTHKQYDKIDTGSI